MRVGAVLNPVWRVVFILGILFKSIGAFGQTDTEFWFVVPDVTYYHQSPGGEPANLTFSAFDMPSTVTISMPANPLFTPIVVNIPAGKAISVPMSDYVNTFLAGKTGNADIENTYSNTFPNKCGLLITATTPITAYYQIANVNNTDIYALKGKNALGKHFYVPFQNLRTNHQHSNPHPAYSSINIVATEASTNIVVKPTKDAYIHGTTVLAGTTKTITLNKGESVCIVPSIVSSQPDRAAAAHLAGTEITSDKNIAITTNDDSVDGLGSGSYDIIGDQLVNMESLGTKYVVLRTQASVNNDDIYVVATEDGTTVTFKNNDGGTSTTYALNAGEQVHMATLGSFCFVESDKKVSVLHVGGYGGELGGAILPAIDKCTGSTQVAFYKLPSSGGKTFNTNIMVRSNGMNKFKLNGVAVDFAAVTGKSWVNLPGTDWYFMQVLDWNTGKFGSLKDNSGNILTNEGDLFHFGVFYGAGSGGCNYGFFSDFNELKINASVAGIDAGETKVCFGSPIQMYATGGTKYKWTPADYLSDPNVFNPIANVPIAGIKQYQVEVSGACNMTETKTINLQILPPVKADFSVDNITGCSPLAVSFKNTSLNAAELRWNFGDGTDTTSNKFSPPGLVEQFSHLYVNNTDKPITYTVQLIVKSEAACGDVVQKQITVYPSVEAKLSRIDPTPSYCSPRSLSFDNISPATPLPASDVSFIWNFGDGTSVNTSNPSVSHNFSVLDKTKQRYNVTLTMMNKYGCKSVASDTVDVYGMVDAYFSLDKLTGCPNPSFDAVLTDGSTGMIATKSWSWDGFSNVPSSTITNAYDISTSNRTPGGASKDVRTIKLDVVGAGGCKDSYKQDITILPYVNALFAIGDSKLCDGEALNITNTSSAGSTEFFWEFGDGATSTAINPSHLYQNSSYATALYDIKLTAKSADGCVSTYTNPTKVTVYSRIEPNFTVSNLGGCAPFNATILNTSKGNATNTYEWNYGDGSALDVEATLVPSKQHLFVNTTSVVKDYFVELKVTNEGGCFATASRTARVYPQPAADFSVDNIVGCNPLPVSFTASTNVPEYDYSWTFDDGATGTSSAASHTYNNFDYNVDKTYSPILTVSSIYGCSATATKTITVHPLLKAAFTVQQASVCAPFDVQITPASLGATSYSWNYGDGRTETKVSSTPFTISYDNTGATSNTYNISLVATNSGGACQATASVVPITVDPRVVANGSFNVDDKCSGAITFTNTSTGSSVYTWNFGDGQSVNTATTIAQKHSYDNRTSLLKSYVATLTAENAKGCKSTKSFSVDIVPKVESAFTYDVVEKCTPMKINLVNTSLNGTDFQWDYGHTIAGVQQVENRTSKAAFDKIIDSESPNTVQTYVVKLTTTDKVTGCSSVATRDLTVYPRVVPSFTSAVTDKCKGSVSFTNATTGASSYTWIFGDQSSSFTTAKLDPVAHTYLNRNATNSTYNAKLVAVNALGCLAEATQDISIVPRVESSFTLEELELCTPVKVKLTNSSLNGHQFTWDYGHTIGGVQQVDIKNDKLAFDKILDSESANGVQSYPIKLTVVDKNTQCADDSTISYTIYPRVVPSFTADKLTGCSDLPVTLTNTSNGGTLSFSWDFNDGQSAKTANVSETVAHTFINRTSSTKNFNVVLTATNPRGCKATASKVIGAFPKVEAAFTFVQPSKCTPFPIDITNSSLNGTEYAWDFGHTVNGNKRDTLTTSKAAFRTYIYNGNATNAQTYTLTLTAKDAVTGCSDMVTKTIDAQPEVKSLFNLSSDKGCTPLSVSFSNVSTGTNSYSWNFGNNTSSASTTPATMTFVNNDTVSIKSYNITLVSKNLDGCSSSVTKRVDVYPRVMADISLDKVSGCTPLAVKVVNSYPSSAYRYEWSLGSNGTSSAQQIPDLNFINSTSDYTVQTEKIKLKVFYKGDASCYKEVERSVDVYPGTRSDFAMDVTEACNPLVVNFSNTSKSFSSATSYRWSFDNLGSSGEVNPKYTFTNLSKTQSITYAIKLRSTSLHGCTDSVTKTVVVRPIPKAQIAINTAAGCAPFGVDVQNLSVGSMPTYSFWLDNDRANAIKRNGNSNVQFSIDNLGDTPKITEVWLKAVSDFGCKDSVSQKVYTYPHVTSAFTFTPSDAGCNPLSVSFSNTSRNAIYYTWDFADGVTAHVSSPSHVFQNFDPQDKVFNVKLTAKSEYGCENSSSKEFTVYSAPIAYFTIDPPLRTYPDASFIFNNLTTPKASGWNYEWTFGDGGKFVGMDPPAYTYKTWGDQNDDYKYYVTLKVSNGKCKDEMKQFLYLKPAIPISIFASSVGSSCSPLETQFTHQAKYFSSIEWNFGDGTTSNEESPSHVYTKPGKYHVQLAVKGDGGTSYSYKTLEVFPNPTASFKLAPAEAMLPEAKVQFYNTSLEASSFSWDFGDLKGTSTEKNPLYTYKDLGSYDVRLHVTSENGCVDETLVKAAVKVVGQGMLKFPNAFIPSTTGSNGGIYEHPDYKNEVFHPISEGVVAYKLLVYNRWGEKLFESSDINVGWDGYYKGKLCEQGVYVYRATGRYSNGKTFDVRGDVTLLR